MPAQPAVRSFRRIRPAVRLATPFRTSSAHRLTGLFLFMAACAFGAENPAATAKAPTVPNSECMDCHEAEFKPRKKGQPSEWIGVMPEVFAKSVHAKLNCVDCHVAITENPHASTLPPAQCATCHQTEATQYATSIHSVSHQMGGIDAASCASCHGTHGILPVKQLDSPVFKQI